MLGGCPPDDLRLGDWFRTLSGRFSRQYGVDATDEAVEFRHEPPKELRGRLVRDFTIIRDESLLELDVRLNGIHERGIAEGHDAAQMCLSDRRSDLPWTGWRPRLRSLP